MRKYCQNSTNFFIFHTRLLLSLQCLNSLQLCLRKLFKVAKVSLKRKLWFPRIKIQANGKHHGETKQMKYEISFGILGCFHDVDFRNISNKQQYYLFWDLLLVHFLGSFLSKQTRWKYLTCLQIIFPGLYSQHSWQ